MVFFVVLGALTFVSIAEHKDALPPLSPAQITKLKQLSIASLASERRVGTSRLVSYCVPEPSHRFSHTLNF